MRARLPDQAGFIERDGVKIGWEAFGDGERTLLFLPPWTMIHSRCWKAQVPYFARRVRAVTFDARGNGRSDRVQDPALHDVREVARDAVAVLDTLGVERAGVVGLSLGAQYALRLWELAPERIEKIALIAPFLDLTPDQIADDQIADRAAEAEGFEVVRDAYEGWQKYNRHYWSSNYPDWVEFFVGNVFTEPHSTKQIEDGIAWALETTPEVLIASAAGRRHEPGQVVPNSWAAAFTLPNRSASWNARSASVRSARKRLGCPPTRRSSAGRPHWAKAALSASRWMPSRLAACRSSTSPARAWACSASSRCCR
jgi:pimeloyl-ACP methyl ester carboxylesterase